MKMEKKILHGYDLMNERIVKVNFHLENNNYGLLKGYVLSPTGEGLKNVAIEITVIDKKYNPPKKKFVGVTFSHKDGSYAISIPINEGYAYKIVPYSP